MAQAHNQDVVLNLRMLKIELHVALLPFSSSSNTSTSSSTIKCSSDRQSLLVHREKIILMHFLTVEIKKISIRRLDRNA